MKNKIAWEKAEKIVEESFQKVPSAHRMGAEEYADIIEGKKGKGAKDIFEELPKKEICKKYQNKEGLNGDNTPKDKRIYGIY